MVTAISLITGALFGVAGLGSGIVSVFTYDDPNPTTGTYIVRYSMWSVAPTSVVASALAIATQNPAFLALNILPFAVFFGSPKLISIIESKNNKSNEVINDIK